MKREGEVRDYFTRDAKRFDNIYGEGLQRNPIQRLVDALFRRRELRQRTEMCLRGAGGARRVLEVGCGSGRVAVALAQAGVEHVTGIDLSDEMCRLAGELAERLGQADRCRFVCASAEAYEPDEPFDAVVAMGVFDYVADPVAMLARLRRLSSGRLVASFPRKRMLLNLPRRLWLKTKRCPVYFYGRRTVEDLMRGAGLELIEVWPIGHPPLVASFVAVGRVPGGTDAASDSPG